MKVEGFEQADKMMRAKLKDKEGLIDKLLKDAEEQQRQISTLEIENAATKKKPVHLMMGWYRENSHSDRSWCGRVRKSDAEEPMMVAGRALEKAEEVTCVECLRAALIEEEAKNDREMKRKDETLKALNEKTGEAEMWRDTAWHLAAAAVTVTGKPKGIDA